MVRLRFPAQLKHVAENGDAAAAELRRRTAGDLDGGAHRRGAGVIAFVDEPKGAPRNAHPMAPAAPLDGGERAKRLGGHLDVGADGQDRRQHAQAVDCPMTARDTEAVGHPAARHIGHQIRELGLDIQLDEPHHRFPVRAEAEDILYAPCLGRRLEAAEVRVVAVEDRGAAGLHAGKYLRLGVGYLVGRGEEGAVHRLDGGDKGGVGTRQPGQGLDLAGVVHAHLEDAEAAVLGHARQAEGQAPVVVEAALVGAGRSLFAEGQLQGLLGTGLADAAGDPDDPCP